MSFGLTDSWEGDSMSPAISGVLNYKSLSHPNQAKSELVSTLKKNGIIE